MDAMSVNMERRFHHSKPYEKRFIGWEKERLKVYEGAIADKFDTLTAISEPDAKILERLCSKPITILPNGVNEDFLEYQDVPAKKYDLIFTGNMGYHPNIKACQYLVEKLLPIIAEDFRPLKLCIAGTSPSAEVRDMANENIEVTGFVEDLRPYLAASKLFVAPLFSGSGLQNKLLESMAMGIPSFTTRLVNNALGGTDKEEIIVCNDMETFAKRIIALLENPQEAERIGQNGRLFIQKNYSWETYNLQLEQLLNK